MRGGEGKDTINYSPDDDAVSAATAYGDGGNDTISFDSFPPYPPPEGSRAAGTVSLYGGAGNDTIDSDGETTTDYSDLTVNSYGQAGDDRLEAFSAFTYSVYIPWFPAARDHLYGGQGDDSYLVLEPTDAVIERPNEGYDTAEVYRTDYRLPANVEKLVLHNYDHWDHRLTGNALDNYMTSNHSDARGTLDGRGGPTSCSA